MSAVISNPHFLDGSKLEPPKNPLKDKWDRLYPPTPIPQFSQVCDGYSCMWCGRCPHGEHWEVPEEDKEVWESYQKSLKEYYGSHGGYSNIVFDVNMEALKNGV